MREKDHSPLVRALLRFARKPFAMLCLIVFLAIVLACVCAPLLTSYPYDGLNMSERLNSPSEQHLLGTDHLGRDLATRLLYGGRVTFSITFFAVAVSLIGIPLGLISAVAGGAADAVISRLADMISAVPMFLFVIFAETLLGWGDGNYKYAIGISLCAPLIRLTRSLSLELLGREYIEAARALGVSRARIAVRHILRNILAPLIIQITGSVCDALLTCTIVGYLGLGVFPPTPEWGKIVAESYSSVLTYPYYTIIPCVTVAICTFALNIIGNSLRDALTE